MPKYTGGFVTNTEVIPAGGFSTSVASGVWSIQEALMYHKAGIFPVSGSFNTIGMFMGGKDGSDNLLNTIQTVNITTGGNTTDFGDTSAGFEEGCAVGSATRAVYHLGYTGSIVNTIEYVAFATAGNGADFGDLAITKSNRGSCGNSTIGTFGGSDNNSFENNIDQINIVSTGNATDFGDLTVARGSCGNGINSTTRGCFFGGPTDGFGNRSNVIDYITFGSAGNATDFGDVTNGDNCRQGGGASSSTRGVMAQGNSTNVLSYITIANTGNATDFGDLSAVARNIGGVSSGTIGAFTIARTVVTIDQVTIASTGNATDFGDLLTATSDGRGAASNAHGGIA